MKYIKLLEYIRNYPGPQYSIHYKNFLEKVANEFKRGKYSPSNTLVDRYKKQQPLHPDNLEIIPIAIFEIKLYQDTAQEIEGVVNRFIEMKDTLNTDNRDLPLFIFLYLQHSQYSFSKKKQDKFNFQLERFKNLFGEDMLMINRISKWNEEGYENIIEGSIYQIMNKIISFINE